MYQKWQRFVLVFLLIFVSYVKYSESFSIKREVVLSNEIVPGHSLNGSLKTTNTKFQFLLKNKLFLPKKQNTMEKTVQLLDEGERSLKLSENRDIVLIIGSRGSGKRTLAHFMAGNNDNLMAVKAGNDNSTGFTIEESKSSETAAPKLWIDDEGIVWYEGVGFSDGQSTSTEIARLYFLKRLIDHAKRIKIVFVVNYASTISRSDNADLSAMLQRAINLVSHIEQYRVSIALIVTNVDAYAPQSKDPMPQWIATKNIGAKLREFGNDLVNNIESEDVARASELVSALSNQDSTGNYTQIGVFFRPDQEGVVSQIQLLKKNREDLRHMIKRSLVYTEINDGDFEYKLSAKSEINIFELSRMIDKKVIKSIQNVVDEIISHYQREERRVSNIMARQTLFVNAAKASFDLSSLDKSVTLKILLTKLIKFLTEEHIFIPKTDIENIFNQQMQLEFLDRVNTLPLSVSPNEWLSTLERLFVYISTEQNWYTFLIDLYNQLSEYNIQNHLDLYDVADLSKWGKVAGNRGILINNYNFEEFYQLFPKISNSLKNIAVTKTKLTTVNDLLNVTLKHEMEYRCEGEKMTVRGEYVILSKIDLQHCGSNIKLLHFYALNTLFVDSNLDFRGDGKEVAMIGNKLVVTTNVVFSFQGQDSSFVPSKQPEPSKKRLTGSPGVPGEPGTNGVNFIGLFNEVSGGERLAINSGGGAGSRGQDGGSSYPRQPERPNNKDGGSSYTMSPNETEIQKGLGITALDKLIEENVIKSYSVENEREYQNAKSALRNPHQPMRFWVRYWAHSECCAADGEAGAGGVGGYGGGAFFVGLEKNKSKNLPKIVNAGGKKGVDGVNVEPCATKKALAVAHIETNRVVFNYYMVLSYFEINSFKEDELCPAKKHEGFNTAYQKKPATERPLRPYEPVISYKAYLREKLNNQIRPYDFIDFYKKIEMNPEVHKAYTVHGFARELQSMENHFYALNKEIDFVPFYESFMDRFMNFSDANAASTSHEDRKILTWLYTSALSKLEGLKTNRYSSLVIDVQLYLQTSITNIGTLKDALKEKIINDRKNEYKKELDAKMEEANNFINKDLSPEIDTIIGGFDSAMDELIQETIAKQNETKDDLQKQEEARRKLEKNMKLRLMTGIFKGIGTCIGFLGPYGQAIGGAVNAATSIGEQFIVDPKAPKKRFTMPPDVKAALDKFGAAAKKITQRKVEAIGKEIKKLEKYLDDSDVPVVREKTIKKIADLKEALKKENNLETANKESVDKVAKDLLEATRDEEKYLKKKGDKTSKTVEKGFKYVGNGLEVLTKSVDIYNTYQGDQDKIDEVSKSINGSMEELAKLEQYEREIYDSMLPMIFNATNDLKDLEKNLDGKSAASLSFQKYKIQKKLRDLKDTLVALTKGYTAEGKIQKIVEKLNEAMVTMVDIYDRIQAYEDQEKLVEYIGALHSTAFENIQIEDTEMKDLINELQIIIQSNIILSQYLNAVHNFKQTVFPFAAAYLDSYQLPQIMDWNRNVTELAQVITYQIESMSNKIKEINGSSTNQNDVDINIGYFDSDNRALEPFYVWKEKENKQDIFDLLSGKLIHLSADVTQSSRFNAIKFSRVGLEFKINDERNKTLEKELKDTLNSFHITMTHPGNSYYRCNNHFYTISSPSQTINFSYEKSGNEPKSINGVYEKLRDGSIILSPYTMWAIQLERGDFKTLQKYRGLIDIELYGYGQYVRENSAICNSDLQKYYRLDGTLSEVNNVHEELLVESSPGVSNYLALRYLISEDSPSLSDVA